MVKEIKQGILFTIVTMVLLGGGYNAVVWAIGRVAFPVAGRGQPDSARRRHHRRLSADRPEVHAAGVLPRRGHPASTTTRRRPAERTTGRRIPTISKPCRNGWMPSPRRKACRPARCRRRWSLRAALVWIRTFRRQRRELQAARVATARKAPVERVRELIEAHTEPPTFGFLGRARVNVLELNLALDEAFAPLRSAGL